ncbi:hypothetical protein SDC9_114544 [bioreactor metagenome]|uniref:Uncharacterized protein n=1 Tax=bioreactor metagenome TaxID=1076179 RepID=A0A645BQA7_9ZZZZ
MQAFVTKIIFVSGGLHQSWQEVDFVFYIIRKYLYWVCNITGSIVLGISQIDIVFIS